MLDFEKGCDEKNPSMVIVAGDVNSTIACALVAAKLLIPFAHVEAGLRPFDMSMQEDINRNLTHRISYLLFTPSPAAYQNLANKGVKAEHITLVGNIIIDSILTTSVLPI